MSLRTLRRGGLIFVEDAAASGIDPRDLRRACARGELVRIRRGVYVQRSDWEAADARQRHLLAVRAVVTVTEPPFMVAGRSAGAIWQLPYAAEWPDEVTLLTPTRPGGKSEPGVCRTMASSRDVRAVDIDELPVTGLARTALDMARVEPFPRAVAVIDRAMWKRNPDAVTRDALEVELVRACYARRARFVRAALELATDLSDSPGESEARAVIHLLGFEQPELQVCFVDDQGRMITDFFWRSVRVAGEFDGKVKYTKALYTGGDPAEVVWREKKREDRLRRQVRGVIRILTHHVTHPAELEALLLEAGIPRR